MRIGSTEAGPPEAPSLGLQVIQLLTVCRPLRALPGERGPGEMPAAVVVSGAARCVPLAPSCHEAGLGPRTQEWEVPARRRGQWGSARRASAAW